MKKNRVLFAMGIAAACTGGACGADAKTATRGPFTFACVSDAPASLTVTFLGSKADRARLTYKGETVVARHAVSADGARYEAEDIEFWNKGDDGVLEWRDEKAKCSLEK